MLHKLDPIVSINSTLLSVVCGSINSGDALSMILEVHDDNASDFTIYLRWPENKHDGYKNYLVSKSMITIIVFMIGCV